MSTEYIAVQGGRPWYDHRDRQRKDQPLTTMTTPMAYTVDEVAAILKVNPRTVYRMLERGELRGFKVGTLWRVPQEALEAFMRGEQR